MNDKERAAALIGLWRLQEAHIVDAEDRPIRPAFGGNPAGYIAYMPDGMMMTVIADADQPALSGDRLVAPVEERAAAFSASSAYVGRYRVEGNRVIHTVEVATYPNWVGTEVVRFVELDGDRVIYRTAPQPLEGISAVIRLIWVRHRG